MRGNNRTTMSSGRTTPRPAAFRSLLAGRSGSLDWIAGDLNPRRCMERQNAEMTHARREYCCLCSTTSTCSYDKCPCAKLGRACSCCGPGEHCRCNNTATALNSVIAADNRKLASRNRYRVRKGETPLPLTDYHPVLGPLTLAEMQGQSNDDGAKLKRRKKHNNQKLDDIVHTWDIPRDDSVELNCAPAEDVQDAEPISTTAPSLPANGCNIEPEIYTTTDDEIDGSTSHNNTQGEVEDEITDRSMEATSASSNVTSPEGTSGTTSVPLCNKDGKQIHPFFLSQGSTDAVAGDGIPAARIPLVARPDNATVDQATNQTRTAPVRVNPYNRPSTTQRDRSEAVSPRTDLTEEDTGGINASQSTPTADVPVNHALFSTARILTADEIRAEDVNVQQITPADDRLIRVYGDTIRQNDGLHLHGGVDEELSTLHRDRYMQVIGTKLWLWDLPNTGDGNLFLDILNQLFKDVIARKCNMELPLLFIACILHKKRGVSGYRQIKEIIRTRLELWQQDKVGMLVKCVLEAHKNSGTGGAVRDDQESRARAYNSKVNEGRLSAAVRNLTDRNKGGLLHPSAVDEISGELVIDVLDKKHPQASVPADDEFNAYPDDAVDDDPFPLAFYEEDVQNAASHLSGGPGPGGLDGPSLKDWLLRRGTRSARLRETMAIIVEKLANGSPEYAMFRAANITRLVALDKEPGVRPVGIGEIWMRLWAHCVHAETKKDATRECANVQLCVGLRSGIEGILHSVRSVFPQSNGWTKDFGDEDECPEVAGGVAQRLCPSAMPFNPNGDVDSDVGAAPDQTHSRYEPNTGFGCALFDASNGFNRLNRYQMLWTVHHLWRPASRFVFNIHRHDIICIVRTSPGQEAKVLHSREGITQGGVMGMTLYGIATTPLAKQMRSDIPEALVPWYADDSSAVGKSADAARSLKYLQDHGPKYGYHPEPAKCVYICKAEDEECARADFERLGLNIKYSRGEQYLGGFVGSAKEKDKWIRDKVDKWVQDVRVMAGVAANYPQAVYIGYVKCKQAEWQYVQRVVANIGHYFEPLEEVIRNELIPALLGLKAGELDQDLRQTLTHSVKTGGLGIQNPLDTAHRVHSISVAATGYLTSSLVNIDATFDIDEHNKTARLASQGAHKSRVDEELLSLTRRGEGNASMRRRDKRNTTNGAWLTVVPTEKNGTVLTGTEWRDSVGLRYNLSPQGMQCQCDGCNSAMTVEHALSCKKGGLVHARHDLLRNEFHNLCCEATMPSLCVREPNIYLRTRQPRQRASRGSSTPTALPPQTPTTTEERGDVGCIGFWRSGRETIFDIRITDTDAKSYLPTEVSKVLERQEKEKKGKYLTSCLEMRKDFTPLVYSVDGVAGREARSAEKRLASMLADKWKRQYSQLVYYVRVRMQIALVRSTSLLIRGSRNHRGHSFRSTPDGSALSDWQTWQDRA